MKILSFDTSNNLASVAIMDDDTLLAYNTTMESSQQAEKLFSLIEECLTSSKLKLSDIDLISVTNGPGSFTGVRIGLAAALGLKMGITAQIISLSNFQVLAYKILKEYPESQIEIVLDARRDQIYYQKFDAQLNNLSKPKLLEKDAIEIPPMNNPDAKMLAFATKFFWQSKLYSDLEPLYIRQPDAIVKTT
jgi:tRNA threonylcarbamoyladenosine biosynthesis protein TsaB